MPKNLKTWLLKPVIVLAALGLSGTALLAIAGSASASTTYTATTSLTNRPDSGNNVSNGGNWAVDTLTRVATLTDLGTDPHRPGYDTYSFSLSDTGTFVTDAAASNPNGLNPLTLITPTSGKVAGTGTWTNFDVRSNITPSAAGVPASQDGAGTSSSDWLAYFFHGESPTLCPATGEESVDVADNCGQETVFSYLYTSCSEHWLDASTDADGSAVGVTSASDLATIGGISGAACPAPAPTPTQGSSSAPPAGSIVPAGGVQTGGGKPSGSLLPFGVTTGALGIVILALAFATPRRRGQQD